MFKECQAVCLPTDEKSIIEKHSNGNYFINPVKEYNYKSFIKNQYLHILSDDKIEIGDWVLNLNWINELNKNPFILCVKRAFTNPDWLNSEDCKSCKKIISSTDGSLGLPSPSPEDLKTWCKTQPKEVLVEYEQYNPLRVEFDNHLENHSMGGIKYTGWLKRIKQCPLEDRVKALNNQISINFTEKTYSTEEVIAIINKVQDDSCSCFERADPESFL
jgi:hypothetical protein